MRLAKFLGRLGRVLITAGVIILLFVAYQLWGTGVHTHRVQDEARADFNRELAGAEGEDPSAPTTTDPSATTSTTGPTATTTTAPSQDAGGSGNGTGPGQIPPPPPEGGAVGQIEIPAIGATWIFWEGVDLSVLKNGPGHYMGTPMPGQEGNAAIAGHRTTYGAPFNRIDELKSGDKIIITYTTGARFTYSYRTTDIVAPDQTEVLQTKDFDGDGEVDNTLTLTACNPKYSARERIVVRARLDEGQHPVAVAPHQFDHVDQIQNLDDSSNADPVSKVPAILWGLAAAAIWLTAYFVGRAWRKWPAYFLGFPFFMIALYIFFENFYVLLPAGF